MTLFAGFTTIFANAAHALSASSGMVEFCFMTTTKACQYADGMGQYADGMVQYAEWAGMVGFCFMTSTKACQGTGAVSGWERG